MKVAIASTAVKLNELKYMLCSAPCLVTTACVCYLSLFLYHLIFTTVGEGGFIIISIIAIIILILQIMEGQRDEGTYPRSPLSKW